MVIDFVEQAGAVVAIVRAQRIDAESAGAFRSAIAPALEGSAPKVRLDLHEVEFLDSTALGAIVHCLRRIGPNREFELCGVGPRLRRIFDLTGMSQMFRIDMKAAIA